MKQKTAWCQPFIWIGMNPITLYLAIHVVKFEEISHTLLASPFANMFGEWHAVIPAIGAVLLAVLLAWFLHSRKIFLRV